MRYVALCVTWKRWWLMEMVVGIERMKLHRTFRQPSFQRHASNPNTPSLLCFLVMPIAKHSSSNHQLTPLPFILAVVSVIDSLDTRLN
ncbi:hypothetical protein L1887_29066 [Cichorium endivia]|nr:hypothetical protein L1887_29066 [Cichorium endivia]